MYFFLISLEYMLGGRIVCLSFLFAMATQVPGWVIQFLLWKSLEEMVNQITKGCFMWKSLLGGEKKVFPKENYSRGWLNMSRQSTEEEELKCLGVCFLVSLSLMIVCSSKQFLPQLASASENLRRIGERPGNEKTAKCQVQLLVKTQVVEALFTPGFQPLGL